jgi:hypothetical protein
MVMVTAGLVCAPLAPPVTVQHKNKNKYKKEDHTSYCRYNASTPRFLLARVYLAQQKVRLGERKGFVGGGGGGVDDYSDNKKV